MTITEFGTTGDGRTVHRITLQAGDLTVALLTLGAVLQSVRLRGVEHDLTLASDSVADYQASMRFHGSVIGPVVNRISGAAAPIAGSLYQFDANQDGRITLHSGSAGTHLKVWHLAHADPASATLTITLPGGEGGFPGTRHLTARFSVLPPATLRMEISATTDTPTLMNVANHSYWNLDGSGSFAGHTLRVAADHILPTLADFIPTGDIAPIAGTDLDFRSPRTVAPDAPALNTCFCLGDARVPLRDVLWLTGAGGVSLTLATTEPGIQVYDARVSPRPGRAPFEGLAIEAQGWPDAPNHPGFPPIDLTPDAPYAQTTEWRFAPR